MEQLSLPTEVFTNAPPKSLGKLYLDWIPQPGSFLEIDGNTYRVLERKHRYQLKKGKYRLSSMVIQVQAVPMPTETSLIDDRLIIGDASCKYNAHSELLRCAINPLGSCASCHFWELG